MACITIKLSHQILDLRLRDSMVEERIVLVLLIIKSSIMLILSRTNGFKGGKKVINGRKTRGNEKIQL